MSLRGRFDRGPVKKKDDGPNVNDQIRAREVRVVTEDGEQLGVMTTNEALDLAYQRQLDLVEISPNATPPVAKLIDYGKFKYQIQKKQAEAKKKQARIQLKEIQLRPNIEKHDLEVKLKKAEEILAEGDKVKLIMQFKGREMAYKDMGMEKFTAIVLQVVAFDGTLESQPKFMGNRVIAIIASNKKT